MSERKTIVIVGGGFAGLNLAKKLNKDMYDVKVIDRNNFHCFPPLFYQIASSGLDASNISFPFRREFKKLKRVTYHMGHVKNIDTANRKITTSYETLDYDYLVLAAGTKNNFFGMPDMEQKVFCIKTVAEASRCRDEILDRLERGAICEDRERRRQLLSFLVVGGGPSGVEIAGALGEMKRDILPREYPELSQDDVTITLVEGAGKLLGPMSEKAGRKAEEYLKDLMVDVRLNTMLKSYDNKTVTFADGHSEYCETLIWTAGVCGEPMPGLDKECVGRGGRIMVDEYNRVKGHEESVFALGDLALMQTEGWPNGHPQVAQPAIQQAANLARNLNKGEFKSPFVYKDKGSMATVGKNRAVADLKGMKLTGRVAWWIWMLIHLLSILGMRNKLNVMLNWVWNYFSYSTSLRLLLRPTKYPERRHWGD
ncbi:MAG: NAD(P)/FAD-dependent oxidoreductase [Bacteroides sp.]|nr:NAD(P)/FAD-dependent oxidoreductase [Bacteroides sp.]MBD5306035.1 NAD(P)/FAD-dependent oxidoreductase [Bacteroides sp.]